LGDQLPLALPDRRDDLRYSTRTLLATEQALLATVAKRRHQGVAVVPSEAVTGALGAHPTLTAEQVALVWELTSSGHGIENVEAGAGAGKTYALRVAVDAFVAAGHPVLGTSTSNLATRTLEQEAGVRALNTTRLLADLDRGEALAPAPCCWSTRRAWSGPANTSVWPARHRCGASSSGSATRASCLRSRPAALSRHQRTLRRRALPGNRRQVDPEEISRAGAVARGRRRRLRPL
jgi:hypothetical protein